MYEDRGQNNHDSVPSKSPVSDPFQGGGVTLSGTSPLIQVSFSSLKTIHLMTSTYERMLSRDQCLKADYEFSAGLSLGSHLASKMNISVFSIQYRITGGAACDSGSVGSTRDSDTYKLGLKSCHL